MRPDTAYKFYQVIKDDKLTLLYQGAFADTITEKIVNIGESFITTSKFSKIRKKVSFLMVECFQNVIRHSDAEIQLKDEHPDFFLVRNQFDYHYITASNSIQNKNISSLKEKLQNVNKLDEQELREYYFNSLSNNEITKKGGAGLGLIEMARKTGQKIDFDFYPLDENYSTFFQQIKFKKAKEESKTEILPIEESHLLSQMMSENNIFLVYKGDFNTETLTLIMNMVEQNLMDKAVEKKRNKSLNNILIEILQNLHRHTPTVDGVRDAIVLLGSNGNLLTVTTGNYIAKDKIQPLHEYLNFLSLQPMEKLKDMSKQILISNKSDVTLNSGLGLITMAKASKGIFNYQFFDVDNDKSFFVITSTV